MPKNFDELRREAAERDRSFVIGGETFVHKPSVAPETMLRWAEQSAKSQDLEGQDAVDALDLTIIELLEPGQEERWRKVRAVDAQHPVTIAEMWQVTEFLMEAVTGRPTGSSDGSPEPQPTPGTPSTVASSRVVARAAKRSARGRSSTSRSRSSSRG